MANVQNSAPTFIGKEALQHVAEEVSKTVFLGPGYVDAEEMTRIGAKIITGVQYKRTDHILVRKGGTTRRKVVGANVNSKIGYIEERTLVAKLSWNRFVDNIDNYTETVFGVDAQGAYPFSTESAEAILKTYAEDLAANWWYGDIENGADGLNLYDGIITLINKEVNDGNINAAHGNYLTHTAISAPASTTDTSAYDSILAWYMGLNPQLRKNCIIICDLKRAVYIAQAYANKFGGNFKVDYTVGGSYKLPEMPGATIVPVEGIGEGDKLIATIPGNLQYGCDTESNQTFIATQVGSDNDVRDVIFQIQSIQGARVMNIMPYAFTVSDGSFTNTANLQGDYTKTTLVLTADGATGASLKVNGAAYVAGTKYNEGATVTLKAEAGTSGKTFKQWSNGATTAEIQVALTGAYVAYTAIFE